MNKFDNLNNQESKSKYDDCIKPSSFNLNLNDGVPKIYKNYSNSLISKPKLNLDQINFNSNSVMKSGFNTNGQSNGFNTNGQSNFFQSSNNSQNFGQPIQNNITNITNITNVTKVTKVNQVIVPQICIQLNSTSRPINIQNNHYTSNNNTQNNLGIFNLTNSNSDESKPNQFSVASLLNN